MCRRAEAGLSWAEAENSEKGKVSSRSCSQAGFLNEAGEGKHGRESISNQDGLGRISQAEEGGSFQAAVSLGGIAALGIGLSADAQLPEIGTDL